jgi:hypothetical protein
MHLPPYVALILGIIGGALEIVQEVAITTSAQTHSIIAFAIVVILAFGVVPLSKETLARLIPAHIAAILTAGVGILAAASQTFNISGVAHSIILFVLALLAAVGIVPSIIEPEAGKRALVAAGRVPASVISTMAMTLLLCAVGLVLLIAV